METKRAELVGRVVSNTNDKTITVLVETYRRHPLYNKRVKYSKNIRFQRQISEISKTVTCNEIQILCRNPLAGLNVFRVTGRRSDSEGLPL